jgi:DNA-binding PadR family transcriptional regulator
VQTERRPSALALAVLGLLAGGPLHPYRMQQLLKEWGKDQVVNVGQRANLYSTIKRLGAAGAIAVRQTERDQQYPERTVYEITDEGRRLVRDWLVDMLATPRNEFPRFPAALSFIMLLEPQEAEACLRTRAQFLAATLESLDGTLGQHSGSLPRVTLLETEYLRAVAAAEMAWVSGVLSDLERGALGWTDADFVGAAESYVQGPP